MNRSIETKALLVVLAIGSGGCFTALRSLDGIACDSATACPEGYWCDVLAKQCRPGTSDATCVRDVDCPFGSICIDSACTLGCAEDGDCGLEQACIGGVCASDPLSCNDDKLCDFGYECDQSSKRCVAHEATSVLCKACADRLCLDGGDCLAGDRCVRPDPERYGTCETCGGGGRCRDRGSFTSCGSNAECGSGETCVKPACLESSHCQGDTRSFGSCTSRPFNPDGKKASGDLRSCSRGYCSKATCVTTGCAGREVACPKGWACSNIVDVPPMSECATNADCPGGRPCVTLRNEENPILFCGCTANSQCASGICEDQRCILTSECRPALGLTCEDLTR